MATPLPAEVSNTVLTTPPTRTPRGEMIAGVKDTIPMIVGAIPFGIIFGTVAVTAGISPEAVMGMSLFVFAGSSQFVAATLVTQGAGLALIVLTTFILNVRHALYSASLAPYMRQLSQRWLLPLGFWLTDETYAIVIRRYQIADDPSPHKHWYMFGSSLAMYLNWQLCTVIGIIAGKTFENADQLGLDFAMSVTFIGIVIPLLVSRPMLFSALVAGITAALTNGLENKVGLMLAAGLGIAAGVLADSLGQRQEKQKEANSEEPTP
jgi:4-azaleucine resistance transporter AzlC